MYKYIQGCALTARGRLRRLTFSFGRLKKSSRSLGTVFRRNCQYFSNRLRARLATRSNLFLYKTEVAVLTSMQM